MHVVLIDEAGAAGGQVYRAPRPGLKSAGASADDQAGDALRAELAASRVTVWHDARVWLVSDRFRIDAIRPGGTVAITAPRLIAATGAHERIVPFPGWQLPGIIGLAAATILLKSQHVLPGQRTLVAGCGPLLAAVAAKIIAAGGEVVAIADLSSRSDWLQALPALASRPAVLRQGIGWAVQIGRKRVPILFRHGIAQADGQDCVASVTLVPVDKDGSPKAGPERVFAIDALAVGHGLLPGGDIPRLMQADQHYEAALRLWLTTRDCDGRTSVPGLYACGDGALVRGATPAALAGERAGLAAARDAGAIGEKEYAAQIVRIADQERSALPFADAINRLMRARPGMVAAIPAETIICRCEDVRRHEIEAAIKAGATELNQLKHFSRAGMGPCQGRSCGDTVAELLGLHIGREKAGQWTARPPLRPAPLGDLLGQFDYADIPVPKPAPL